MFGVGDSVSDDILQEDLEDGINSTHQLQLPWEHPWSLHRWAQRFAWHLPSWQVAGSQAWWCPAWIQSKPPRQQISYSHHLDVIPQHLPVPLGASLSQALSTFATSSHCLFNKLLLWLECKSDNLWKRSVVNFLFSVFGCWPRAKYFEIDLLHIQRGTKRGKGGQFCSHACLHPSS